MSSRAAMGYRPPTVAQDQSIYAGATGYCNDGKAISRQFGACVASLESFHGFMESTIVEISPTVVDQPNASSEKPQSTELTWAPSSN